MNFELLTQYGVLGIMLAITLSALVALTLYIKRTFEAREAEWKAEQDKWSKERENLVGVISELRVELAKQGAEIISLQKQIGRQEGIDEVKSLVKDLVDQAITIMKTYEKN